MNSTNNAPDNKSSKSNIILLVIGGISIFLIFCCILFVLLGSGSSEKEIKYVISGNASSALITYFNETGGTEQINVNIPFEKILSVESGAALSLVAQNNGSGSITCEIWVDGEQTKTSTSTAQYGVVTCSDFVR